MLTLALDTSSAAVAVAVVDVIAGRPLDVQAQRSTGTAGHGELLAPSIAACLADAGHSAADVRAVVAGLGPGPFTGLRVGLVTAAAFADALGVPAYGACSLDAISPDLDRDILVATDARRHEVYWGHYRGRTRVAGPEVAKPVDVPLVGVTAMAGAGARLYADVFALELLDVEHADPVVLVELARERIESGAPSETLVPLYLRRPDAVPPASMKAVR